MANESPARLSRPEPAVEGLEIAVDFAVNGSLNLRRTVLQVLTAVRPVLADWAMLAMSDHRTGGLGLFGGADVGFCDAIARSSTAAPGLDQVLRTGQHALVRFGPDCSAADVDAVIHHPAIAEQIIGLRPVDVLIVGLTARGATLGALVLARGPGRHFDDDGIARAERLAALAAVALDSARIYSERGELAAALQRTLRPPVLPRPRGLGLAARYRPAIEHLEVGGDFYDVVGPDDDLLITVGDVCGKGADSAAVTLQARQSIRTAAHFDRRPERLLDALNSVLCEQSTRKFVTVLCARVRGRPDGTSAEVQVAAAGHPSPIMVRANGFVEQIDVVGVAAGVKQGVVYRPASVQLQRGDALLMFTDGVEEARRDARLYGMRRLLDLLPAYAGAGADVICEAVERDVLEYLDGDPHDDMALVAVTCGS
ncbi:serine/threonine protein phosphatase [Mycolicibacterium litorale]|nr:serine/threonine protein phosphatase [Mycolicibacterium litorale]